MQNGNIFKKNQTSLSGLHCKDLTAASCLICFELHDNMWAPLVHVYSFEIQIKSKIM